jgi:hypothetical protein
MGSCCGTESKPNRIYPGVEQYKNEEYKNEKYRLPKIILTAQDATLMYIDRSSTKASQRLKNSLKHKFPNLVSCDGEKRIMKQIEMMKLRKYYIVIVGNIREETLRSMLRSPKVKSIYFALEQINLGHYPKSPKIKGFFKNQMDLKKAIFNNMRFDELK